MAHVPQPTSRGDCRLDFFPHFSRCSTRARPRIESLAPRPVTQSLQYLRKWIDRGRLPPGSLEVIPEVESPELRNRRDILVYLPASYAKNQQPYPVIYMHDGQNLFDPTTSFAGEWGIDVALAKAPRKGRRAIIVGIPNMGIDRVREYSPYQD